MELVACCLRCVLDMIEFLNKFSVCMHAITGEDLCASGRAVSELLARHGLSAWMVDRVSYFVLSATSVAFAFVAFMRAGVGAIGFWRVAVVQ